MESFASIVSLWRYPIKSMLGEELNASAVSEAGLLGDRSMALIDTATGKVASAKNPTKWRKLFDCRANFTTAPHGSEKFPPVRITLPDGRMLTSDHEDVDSILSEVLAR